MARILLINHALSPPEASGTPLITTGYAAGLSERGHDVHVLAPTDAPRPSGRRPGEAFTRHEVPATARRWAEWALHDERDGRAAGGGRTRAALDVVRAVDPDVVHVVDLVHLPSELPDDLAGRVPLVRQVWNAEDVCGLIEPLGLHAGRARCPTPITPELCSECCTRVLGSVSLPAVTARIDQLLARIQEHRANVKEDFAAALRVKHEAARRRLVEVYDRLVFAAASFRDFLAASIPLDEHRTRVIPHGVRMPDGLRGVAHPDPTGTVTFVFLGNLTVRKGADVLGRAFASDRLTRRDDHRLVVHGDGDAGLLATARARHRDVRLAGGFGPADLPRILADATVGVVPSVFETFHRVTREVLAAGLPVIGTPAFGIPDVVEPGRNGTIVPAGDPEALALAVEAVLDDRPTLAHWIDGAAATAIRTPDDELDDLEALYAELGA